MYSKKPVLKNILFSSASIAGVSPRSIELNIIPQAETALSDSYLQNLEKEIHFLWNYGPFKWEHEFAELVLNYIFSETRIGHSNNFPFKEVHIKTAQKTYRMDKFSFNIEVEITKFGLVDVLFANTQFGAYRLRVNPGHKIAPHIHHVMEEKEIILSEGLLLNGQPISIGTINKWGLNVRHEYENKTEKEQSILCIDEPPFDINDEVLV